MTTALHGRRILVVEDEELIAMLIEETLIDQGCMVIGPAATLAAALALARDEAIDAAVLDVNLAGARTDAVADLLATRGIPFLFATGYGDRATSSAHAKAPVIGKPFTLDALVLAIERLIG
jgi:DNA-binding response OmpR family regulator